MHRTLQARLALFIAAMLTACGSSPADRALAAMPEARLDGLGDVHRWRREPIDFYAEVRSTLSFLAGHPGCPSSAPTAEGGMRLEGGCIDVVGTPWVGSAEVTGFAVTADGGVTGRATFEGFGVLSPGACPGAVLRNVVTGSLEASEADGTFEVATARELDGLGDNCEVRRTTHASSYRGSHAAEGWSGSGALGSSTEGRVLIDSRNVNVDYRVCGAGSASGTTTLRASDHVAEIVYSGANPCGHGVTVSIDGVDQGVSWR